MGNAVPISRSCPALPPQKGDAAAGPHFNVVRTLSVAVATTEAALYQIVQRHAAKVVPTVRNGEPLSKNTGYDGGQFDRLDLQTLSGDKTTILVSAALSGPLDPDAARRLWKLTHGNVLYMRNIVEQEVGDGRLVRQHGYWRWIGEPIVPPILVELIESRFVPGGGFESMGEWREGDNFEAGFSAASEAVAWVLKLLLLAARRQR